MQFLDPGLLGHLVPIRLPGEQRRHPLDRLAFPQAHHVRVDLESRRDLRQRRILLQRCQGDLRFKLRRVPLPVPFAHFLLLPSVESSPYPTVRKKGTISFRRTYNDPAELESAVELSLAPLIRQLQKPEVKPTVITERLYNPHRYSSETGLRFILAPERVDEMVDPVALGSKEFGHRLLEIGHALGVDLFSYDYPKTTEIGVNEIILVQSGDKYRRQGSDEVRLELTTRGMLIVDLNVTGCPSVEGHENYMGSLVLTEEGIVVGLKRCFGFAGAYYRERDPFKRYDRMLYNAALSGIGMRTLTAKPPQGRSYPMGSHGETIVSAFDDPRLITRADLDNPGREIETVMTLFRRRLR